MKDNYRVIYADFQTDNIQGAAVQESKDSYLILINSRLSEEEQKDAFLHELYHIEHHHFDFEEGGRAVDQIELEAHENSTKKSPFVGTV